MIYDSIKINQDDYDKCFNLTDSQCLDFLYDVKNAKNAKKESNENDNIILDNEESTKYISKMTPQPPKDDFLNISNRIREQIFTSVKKPESYIPCDHVNSEYENLLLKYALNNVCDALNVLIDNIDKKFEIYTNGKSFQITISKDNIPHLLAFVSKGLLKNGSFNTRFYKAICDEFKSGNKDYLENIKKIITNYKLQIFESISKKDTYSKEPWSKIANKTVNIKSLQDLIKLNSLNQIEVFDAKEKDPNENQRKNDKSKKRVKNLNDTYLLATPAYDKKGYILLVIEYDKLKQNYYVKSDCLNSKQEFEKNKLCSCKNGWHLERYYFYDTNLINKAVVVDDSKGDVSYDLYVSKIAAKSRSNQNYFCTYNYFKKFNGDHFTSFDQTNENVCDFLNTEKIADKIKQELKLGNNVEKLKSNLPNLLLKYFIASNATDVEMNNFCLLLTKLYCDDDLAKTIKECFKKNNRVSFKKNIFKDKENVFECSISKTEDFNLRLNMISHNQILSQYNSSVKDFGMEYYNVKEKLRLLLNKIKSFKINNNNDALEYLFLLNSYYQLSINFEEVITSVKSWSKISDYAISSLKNNWYDIYKRLIKIGYLNETTIDILPVFNYKTFDELIVEYQSKINVSNESINAINFINYERCSENIINILSELSIDQIEYVLFVEEMYSLRSIVSILQSNENENLYSTNLLDAVERFKQITNIRKIVLDNSYIKTLKMAG